MNNIRLEKIKNTDEIQEIALEIYGKYDLEKSLIWMMEEFGEVISAIRKGKTKKEICGELGDLTAWIFCIGNILDIKISDSVTESFSKEIDRQLMVYGALKCKSKSYKD